MTVLSLAAALLESDRRYFELGASVEGIEGAEVAWVPGMEAMPAGCVVHRVRPSVIGGGGAAEAEAAAEAGAAWVADVTRRLRGLRCGLARVYLDQPDPDPVLDRALAGAGYRRRVETGFLAEGPLAAPPPGARDDVALREIVDDDGWEAKAKLHAGSDVAADGHVSRPEEWVEFERRKCATGGMRAFLVEVDGEVCGALATLEGDGLLRAKNVFVHADRRREGIAAESLRVLSRRAVDLGLAATGIFGVDGRPGAAVYVHLRMTAGRAPGRVVAAPLTLAERYRDDGYVLVRGHFGAAEAAAWVGGVRPAGGVRGHAPRQPAHPRPQLDPSPRPARPGHRPLAACSTRWPAGWLRWPASCWARRRPCSRTSSSSSRPGCGATWPTRTTPTGTGCRCPRRPCSRCWWRWTGPRRRTGPSSCSPASTIGC